MKTNTEWNDRHPLVLTYKSEVHDKLEEVIERDGYNKKGDRITKTTVSDLLLDTDFHSLTVGWAIAKGLNADEAYDFATFIRYDTNLGRTD